MLIAGLIGATVWLVYRAARAEQRWWEDLEEQFPPGEFYTEQCLCHRPNWRREGEVCVCKDFFV